MERGETKETGKIEKGASFPAMHVEEPSLVSFTFPSVRTLSCCVKYLCFQGHAVKLIISRGVGSSEVRLSRAGVPDCNYSEIVMEVVGQEKTVKTVAAVDSGDEEILAVAVDGPLFLRAIRLFEGYESLTLELGCDLTSLFLHPEGFERWARIGVYHDLGPLLNVEHEVTALHRISDVHSFCHIVQFVSASHEATCTILLRFDNFNSLIELKTSETTASTPVYGECLQGHMEGRAGTLELAAFAELALRVHNSATLWVGFGMDGLAMFKLEWKSIATERSVAYLYFCTE